MVKPRKPKSQYRSSMEERIVPPLVARGAKYEPGMLPFQQRTMRRYKPDVVLENGIVIEIKGWFTPADRSKMLDVQAAYPGLEIRMVLNQPNRVLFKGSKTTQAAWCQQHNILWAHNEVPDSWLEEPPFAASLVELRALKPAKVKA